MSGLLTIVNGKKRMLWECFLRVLEKRKKRSD